MWVKQQFSKTFFLLLAVIVVAACSKKEEESQRLKQQSKSCMNQFFASQYTYFFEPENVEQTQENLDCVDQRLAEAEEHISSHSQVISQNDFLSWLNQNYFADKPMSSSHLASWLLFKKWIVGGEKDQVTSEEVKQLRGQVRAWKTFILKINRDLDSIVHPDSEDDVEDIKKYKDTIAKNLDEFLFNFPDLISNFDYESFVALTLENQAYHNNSLLAVSPSLIRSVLWFANGQENTVLNRKTAQFLLMTHFYYYSFRSQVGQSWSDIFFNIDEFTSFANNLSLDLNVWLQDVRAFDYQGFQYLSEYLSQRLFDERFSSDEVFNFIKMVNQQYLTEGSTRYIAGFGLDQNESLKDLLEEIVSFNTAVDNNDLLSIEESWTSRFLRRHRRSGLQIVINEEDQLHLVEDEDVVPNPDVLKLINFISVPLNRVVSYKGSYYTDSLTRQEFEEVIEEFSLLKRLWEVPQIGDRFDRARSLGNPLVDRVTTDNLFHFITPLIQSPEYEILIVNE
ncbi:MAG: hypothetical protein HRT44_10080 [Bdellovibrionales bacterium]|nr:hypothetical protein [Bdellovibrionales bacterium]NQZ19588.1 hypothetical protein [Bdellovibrionales bacterium]